MIAALLLSLSLNPAAELRQWGQETLRTIRRDFYMPERKLYADALVPGQPPKQVAFNWGCGVMLSSLNAGARSDRRFDPWLREFADATRTYWNPKPPVAGYDVLPGPKDVDRYYDDNAWMCLALVETYEHLQDRKYLRWAEQTLNYVLSGEDARLGGGIYWGEGDKASKNTCSNAPAAAACLALYAHNGDSRLLHQALQLYGWTRRHLMDPADHLMWDSISLDGRISKDKWSYNTALMIRTASDLYRITRLPSYRVDALAFEEASVRHWVRGGRFTDPGRFSHLLLESWLYRRRAIPGAIALSAAFEPLRALHEAGRSSRGHYPDRWSAPAPNPGQKVELIDQASYARACFVLAAGLSDGGAERSARD